MRRPLIPILLCVLAAVCRAGPAATAPTRLQWQSAAVGHAIKGELYPPAATRAPHALYVYQKNLSVPRTGQEPDDSILDSYRGRDVVLVLDYAHDPKAVSPDLNADSLKLRADLTAKSRAFLADQFIDVNRVYLMPEGYRVEHVTVGDRQISTDGRWLGMDVAYPSKPFRPVPLLLEFSCDNASRMGAASLLFCHDTLLDGGMYRGFAVAMADHPVNPPYKGLDDPMPDVFWRAKRTVLAAEDFAKTHGLLDRIGLIGFSRGGPIAAMLAANTGPASVPPGGGGDGIDGRPLGPTAVRAALIHGNRYDYLDLLPGDKMAPRFQKAWGDPTTQPLNWQLRGASNYLAKDKALVAPMFLNTSRAESPEYQDGLAKFDKRLTALGVEHVYQVDDDKRGHQVSTDPKTLTAIYDFFAEHLNNDPK